MALKDKEAARAYSREYYYSHPEKRKTKEEINAATRKCYYANLERSRRNSREHARKRRLTPEGREKNRVNGEKFRNELRETIFFRYSNGTMACVSCGEGRPDCLSVDHIGGGGNKHRIENKIHGGYALHQWLKKNGFPDGYRILCMNCQFIDKNQRMREEAKMRRELYAIV